MPLGQATPNEANEGEGEVEIPSIRTSTPAKALEELTLGEKEGNTSSVASVSISESGINSEEAKLLDLPKVTYKPAKLFDQCLEVIGRSPDDCITLESISGRGETITAVVLAKVVENGKLTVPLVRIFEQVAKQQDYPQICRFIEKLDVFAALPIYIPPPTWSSG
mmetsp:Transcript_13686/g.16977  ORF Transcript_13686/g.16977 Transcript_13686/m.16977 type:complete len:165 (-) Transcript_13686:539-1033(-)|eukprot:CAMPEP_0204823972 /NCGR_PEP_ID=MMETSP1346-20131115/2040_1 /ASSEMBLY_ACC=CAM_ASM_000771 /TAXON_ID=215587 /ORGANISM="Aplanochytrium stocchinoi, Strain GSBS06" /LENGTH=164 /DNA_ID=CAMNT_0051950881 /DNA_START=207 /DNA_END=701 /DNA_ORIENTATION=-